MLATALCTAAWSSSLKTPSVLGLHTGKSKRRKWAQSQQEEGREGGEETMCLQATSETGTGLEPGQPEFPYQLPPCLRGLRSRPETTNRHPAVWHPTCRSVSLILRAF